MKPLFLTPSTILLPRKDGTYLCVTVQRFIAMMLS